MENTYRKATASFAVEAPLKKYSIVIKGGAVFQIKRVHEKEQLAFVTFGDMQCYVKLFMIEEFTKEIKRGY